MPRGILYRGCQDSRLVRHPAGHQPRAGNCHLCHDPHHDSGADLVQRKDEGSLPSVALTGRRAQLAGRGQPSRHSRGQGICQRIHRDRKIPPGQHQVLRHQGTHVPLHGHVSGVYPLLRGPFVHRCRGGGCAAADRKKSHNPVRGCRLRGVFDVRFYPVHLGTPHRGIHRAIPARYDGH